MSVKIPAAASNVVIVGGGLAGLFAALRLAPLPVTVITAAPLGQGAASAWAQGGIAAAVSDGDSAEAHAADTIAAGAGLVDDAVARLVTSAAAARVHDLLAYGVPFDRDLEDKLICSREAAHSAKRVVRVKGDAAGRAIMHAIIDAVHKTPSITLIEGYTAIRLKAFGRTVTGLVIEHPDDPAAHVMINNTQAIVLATGGIGALYDRSTNPDVSRGNAIALSARAGAAVSDTEFVQFHPTAVDVDTNPTPLATEALRGEGATLINRHGDRFMFAHHADGELGPRDIVARGVFEEIKADRGAFLDCREAIGADMPDRFPTVYGQCRAAGINPVDEPIPVTPAEHYHMGGVKTDRNGRTGVDGLWAIGECAATGLHGANRLASNSLLEAVVFAARAASDIAATVAPASAQCSRVKTTHLPDEGARAAAMTMIRATMGEYVGVVRDEAGLRTAVDTLAEIENAAEGDSSVANAALTARFIAEACLRRKESRGAHFRSDYPAPDDTRCKSQSMTLQGLNLRQSMTARDVLAAALRSDGDRA